MANSILGCSLLLLALVKASRPCALCGDSSAVSPKNYAFVLEIDPRLTCQDLWADLLTSNMATDETCRASKESYESICCEEEDPDPIISLASPPPPQDTNDGQDQSNEPICPICKTGEYPGNPSAFIQARYVGTYSCAELYTRGVAGLIPRFMCGPLQDFAQDICGCGVFNPSSIPNTIEATPSLPPQSDALLTEPPANVSQGDATSCSQEQLAQIAGKCDCSQKKPGKPWKNEEEYMRCIDKQTSKDSSCLVDAVVDYAKCLPLVSATPSETANDSISQETCTDIILLEVAEKCNCFEKNPGKRWKHEEEYAKCVKKATKDTFCDMKTVFATDGCHDFESDTESSLEANGDLADDCSDQEIELLSEACDCAEKKPGKPWKDKGEYEKCVAQAANKNSCKPVEIMNFAGCLPLVNGSLNDSTTGEHAGCFAMVEKRECEAVTYCKWKKGECNAKKRRLNDPEKSHLQFHITTTYV